jgi:hypothetical protein
MTQKTRRTPFTRATGLVALFLLVLLPRAAGAAIEAGATVRNDFGPDVGLGANMCRGACGGGCPRSCEIVVSYECMGASQLRRVEAFTCGTHRGCREHDDCLDACIRDNPGYRDCQPQCDAKALEVYGASAASWLLGKGPYDGKATFEYTRQGPRAPEPAYRCPEGARRECGARPGCVTAGGGPTDPVFDAYPSAGRGGMQISRLQTGPLCGDGRARVCTHSATIQLSGTDACPGGNCTRFGMEFDYQGADPSAPLECSTSTRGGEDDFVGDLIKLGGDAIAERNATTGGPAKDDGLGQLMGTFANVIASGDSPEDVEVSMAPMDAHGRPIESQRVGSEPRHGPPPIPRTVAIPAASGHLFIPMYQLADNGNAGTAKERRVTCTHKGEPVLETVFVLQAEPPESAEQMQQSLHKNDAEKKSFSDEADALEAELGL